MNFLNEWDEYAADWLQCLIDAGELPPAVVDRRSIKDVRGSELVGYDQCHFFGGIAGWPVALRLAGWPDDRAVWTGSCPCQPFSPAGKRKGAKDDRHLWPDFFRVIQEHNEAAGEPVATVLGEQVASRDGLRWLDGVFTDLEGAGYTCGAADLPAAGAGAPHIRQRLFWVAIAKDGIIVGAAVDAYGLGHGLCSGPQGFRGDGHGGEEPGRDAPHSHGPVATPGVWNDFSIVHCRDGRSRRVGTGVLPLAHGLPRGLGPGRTRLERMALMAAKRNRVGRIRGYGNAIVPEVAARFIRAVMEWIDQAERQGVLP